MSVTIGPRPMACFKCGGTIRACERFATARVDRLTGDPKHELVMDRVGHVECCAVYLIAVGAQRDHVPGEVRERD